MKTTKTVIIHAAFMPVITSFTAIGRQDGHPVPRF